MHDLSIVILAAGNSTRMVTGTPKVLHQLAGVPLLVRVVQTAISLNPQAIYVVYGGENGKQVKETLAHLQVTWVKQDQPRGTGHALAETLPHIKTARVMVLYADVPLISQSTLQHLFTHTPEDGLGLLVSKRSDPHGFGRIIRDAAGRLIQIVEEKEASPAQKAITEVNTGIMVAATRDLRAWLPDLKAENAQKEYYLTDIVAIATQKGRAIKDVSARSFIEVYGVNTLSELLSLERTYQRHLAESLIAQGVIIMDAQRIDIRGEVKIAPGVILDINVILAGQVSIGAHSVIGPHSILRDVTIGKQVSIKSHCSIEGARIDDHCQIGPCARIRAGTHIHAKARIGNFVEIKKTEIGELSKVLHLSYVGDAIIGSRVNMGAGSVTVNYDGVNKHTSVIKDGAFIGCHSQLIAPIEVGEQAFVAAGSTISQNAPPHQLTIARSAQRSIAWKCKKKPPSKQD